MDRGDGHTRRTLHNLQALRGVACLAVVAYHLAVWEREYGVRTPVFELAYWFGFAGVDLFFALSGFIITYTHADRAGHPRAVPGYLFRRAWRVYPTYWAAAGVAALSWAYLLNNPLRTPGWEGRWLHWLALRPGEPYQQYVAPAWTLPYELMFYLGFAGLLALPPRAGPWLLAGWGAGVLAHAAAGRPIDNRYLSLAASPFVLEFLGGCLAAGLVGRGVRWPGRAVAVAGGGYLGAAAGVVGLAGDWGTVVTDTATRVAVFGPPAVFTVYGMAVAECRGEYQAPRWLRPVGDASYSIYLTHGTVGRLAVVYGCYLPHTRLAHLGWLVGTLAGCLLVGFAMYWAVERPLLRLVARRPRGRPAAAPRPTAPVRRAA
ncbi:MAG: acyltransferase [Gemmataceae bacterium]